MLQQPGTGTAFAKVQLHATHGPRARAEHNLGSSGGPVNVTVPQDGRDAARRAELVESPATKMLFKDFFRAFRLREKEGYAQAVAFAQSRLNELPSKVHWRVYLEMADLAKRENRIDEARRLFQLVEQAQPNKPHGWLEHAKMEEECGQLDACQRILDLGLAHCDLNENLMVKGIKHQERMGNIPAARALLARLRHASIDKAWRTVLEGALLEARAGKVEVARKIFKYLIKNVPWYGPIYYEAYRFEEKCEEYDRAVQVVEKGLSEIPRYGPLWFSAFRLREKLGGKNIHRTRETVASAMGAISKELIWKVFFEKAQIEERACNLVEARAAYVQSALHCPANLRWKVWLGGARTELNADNIDIARQLLRRSLAEVPKKSRAVVLLEQSRVEEYAGDLDTARRILAGARAETRHEWKVFLESVLLEVRAGNTDRAIAEAESALEIHTGTGRLWAVLIQLKQREGQATQLDVFVRALREVPKSGEVWCEGARIFLNPCSDRFNLLLARRFLGFAIQFTPQYGDSFVEFLRLELLSHGSEAETKRLDQLCVNADPNYGAVWFHCKTHTLDSTRKVLRTARALLLAELAQYRQVYQNAIIRSVQLHPPGRFVNGVSSADLPVPGAVAPPPLELPMARLGDFVTGIVSLNRMYSDAPNLSLPLRRKLIFGSDQIIP